MLKRLVIQVLVIAALATFAAAEYVDNDDGKFDGTYRASALNKITMDRYDTTVRISGDKLRIETTNGMVETRIRDIYDWGSYVEFTCSDPMKAEGWRVEISRKK